MGVKGLTASYYIVYECITNEYTDL